ncbi:MAG: hypothetical protein U0R44_01350 [Candidatus Micrarchaeia archaeon]
MKHVIMRYKARKDKVEAVKKALADYVDSVRGHEPYTVCEGFAEGEDGFMHMTAFRDAKSERLHNEAGYTNRFFDLLYQSCTEQPATTEIRLVRSSRPEHREKW